MDQPDSPLRALREGRISVETAARWMEQQQREVRAAARQVRAHSHQTALRQAHEALDRGHPANYPADEFAKMFPPRAPLGPDDDHDMAEDNSFAPPRKGPVQQSNGKQASAADADDADFTARLAALYPSSDASERDYAHDQRVAAARSLSDDELHSLLFPQPYTRRPVDE